MPPISAKATAVIIIAAALLLLLTASFAGTPIAPLVAPKTPLAVTSERIWEQQPPPTPPSDPFFHPHRTQLSDNPPDGPHRYYLALIAVFKNEAHILREWLEHYRAQGVDHVVLVNNNSTDPFGAALRPFLGSGFVSVVKDNRPHRQLTNTNKFFRLKLKGHTRWVLVLDTDEFMYAPAPGATVASVLRELERRPDIFNASQVCVPWQTFGASNYTRQPRCVVQSFTRRIDPTPGNTHLLTKCIVRSDRERRLMLHHHVAHGDTVCADGSPEGGTTRNGIALCGVGSKEDFLRLNHYQVQARDFFTAVKAKRGDATNATLDTVRNETYWDKHNNAPSTPDTELATLQAAYQDSSCRPELALTEPYGYHRILADLAAEGRRGATSWN